MTRFGAVIGAICALIALAIAPLLQSTNWLLLDAFTRGIAAHTPADPRVVVVSVNEKSVRNLAQIGYGRPPYPRDVWAQAIGELQRAGARVIALDLGLYEEDLNHPEGDRAFAAAIQNAPVVLGVNTDPRFPRALRGYEKDLWHVTGCGGNFGVVLPFTESAPAIGTTRLVTTSGVVHEYVITDASVPSLALESARMFLNLPRTGECRRGEFIFSGRRIPVPFLIRWHSAPKFIDFDKLLVAALAREDPSAGIKNLEQFEAQFRGKIVLIGYTAQGLFDLRATPLDPKSAGVLIHANAIDDILNAQFNREANPI
ncbi:MAG TPA: CHASE2 domain-containing protein, partial [Thermoanaerobaculia bacterium]|nr:CHASE2 domain-containing protein [Thermoanaerobaculia bacterium]